LTIPALILKRSSRVMPGLPKHPLACATRPCEVVQLTRNTGRDDNDVGAGKSALETVVLGQVSGDSLLPFSNSSCVCGAKANSYRWCGDVREVGSDTWCVDDIVEGELVNELAVLEEEREGLSGGQFGYCL
jgi:hypothetical protein